MTVVQRLKKKTPIHFLYFFLQIRMKSFRKWFEIFWDGTTLTMSIRVCCYLFASASLMSFKKARQWFIRTLFFLFFWFCVSLLGLLETFFDETYDNKIGTAFHSIIWIRIQYWELKLNIEHIINPWHSTRWQFIGQ